MAYGRSDAAIRVAPPCGRTDSEIELRQAALDGERRGKDYCGLGSGWSVVEVDDVLVLFFDVLSGTSEARSHVMAVNAIVHYRHL